MIKKEEKAASTENTNLEGKITVKNNIIFQVKKEDREYTFSIPYGAPLGVGLDACFQIANEIIAILQKAVKDSQEKIKKDASVAKGNTESSKKDTSVQDIPVKPNLVN